MGVQIPLQGKEKGRFNYHPGSKKQFCGRFQAVAISALAEFLFAQDMHKNRAACFFDLQSTLCPKIHVTTSSTIIWTVSNNVNCKLKKINVECYVSSLLANMLRPHTTLIFKPSFHRHRHFLHHHHLPLQFQLCFLYLEHFALDSGKLTDRIQCLLLKTDQFRLDVSELLFLCLDFRSAFIWQKITKKVALQLRWSGSNRMNDCNRLTVKLLAMTSCILVWVSDWDGFDVVQSMSSEICCL